MTVLGSGFAISKDWEGFREAQFPIGAWEADVSVTGDASGGARQISITFRQTGQAPSALAYSLEDISLQDLDDNTKNVQVFSSGFKLIKQLLFNVGASAGGTFASVNQLNTRGLPLFLGRVEGVVGAALTIQTSNVDLALFNVRAEGYTWSQRSILTPGGYQRPLTNPWGQH